MFSTGEPRLQAGEMAAKLGIADSTLRKWCRVLEAEGYRISRGDYDRRIFSDRDATALRYFKQMTDTGIELEKAAKAIVERFSASTQDAVHPVPHSATQEIAEREAQDNALQKLLVEHVQQQQDFNAALIRELAEQRRIIEETLRRQDETLKRRDEQLMLAIREMQSKKRPWWQFWR